MYNVTLITKSLKGRLQRASAKISDFQTTPSPCPGVSEFPKPPAPRMSEFSQTTPLPICRTSFVDGP